MQERFPASNVLDSNVHCLYNVGYAKKEYIKEQNWEAPLASRGPYWNKVLLTIDLNTAVASFTFIAVYGANIICLHEKFSRICNPAHWLLS